MILFWDLHTKLSDTVDGSEIRRENQFEVGGLSHYLQGFIYIPGGFTGFLSSTVLGSPCWALSVGFSFAEACASPCQWGAMWRGGDGHQPKDNKDSLVRVDHYHNTY